MRGRVILAVLCAATSLVPAVAQAQKLAFVVRHAERADDPARNQENPGLSAAGRARAAKLRDMLQDAGVSAIYVSQYRRTQETAAPLAAKLGLQPELMPPNVPALVSALRSRHGNGVVLIVAHSSTIAGIVKGLAGAAVEVDESDYGNLIVVVPAANVVSKLRY